LERAGLASVTVAEEGAQCIYCLKRDGDFSTEEHVIPESLGGDEIVLSGCVCSTCNNVLSQLDQTLLEFEPIAMLRTMYGPLTKKGRFPSARLGNLDIVKVASRELRMTLKTPSAVTTTEHLEDGTVRFSIKGKGRKRFDPVPLARALFKVGLGLVAHHAGPEVALESRYDQARGFVMSGMPMPNHLVISTTGTPHATISTWCNPTDESTVVGLDIFGVAFAFNLAATPFGLGPDTPPDAPAEFWLGGARDDTPRVPSPDA
jgi:hypothetical protein